MEDNFVLFVFLTAAGFLLFISLWNFITHIRSKNSKKNSWVRQLGMEAGSNAQIQFSRERDSE